MYGGGAQSDGGGGLSEGEKDMLSDSFVEDLFTKIRINKKKIPTVEAMSDSDQGSARGKEDLSSPNSIPKTKWLFRADPFIPNNKVPKLLAKDDSRLINVIGYEKFVELIIDGKDGEQNGMSTRT